MRGQICPPSHQLGRYTEPHLLLETSNRHLHRRLMLILYLTAPDLQALLLTEPEPSLRRMWEMAEQALDTILTNLPVGMGKDTWLAGSILMWNGANCHQSAVT